VNDSNKALTPAQNLALLASGLERLRDALVMLSLALQDYQFDRDTASQAAAQTETHALLDRARLP
jgi:hypothetical protein